jgi:hypothetical protein
VIDKNAWMVSSEKALATDFIFFGTEGGSAWQGIEPL